MCPNLLQLFHPLCTTGLTFIVNLFCAKEVEALRASEAMHLAEITQTAKDQTVGQHRTTCSEVKPDPHFDVDFDDMDFT